MRIDIREAQQVDYPTIGELIKNELAYPLVDLEKLYTRLNKMKTDVMHATVVADIGGGVAGFVGAHRGLAYNIETEYIQILAIAVKKDLQNRGIGSRLIKWVEDYAVANNAERIVLTSRLHRVEAHAFYESNGFIKKSYGFMKEVSR